MISVSGAWIWVSLGWGCLVTGDSSLGRSWTELDFSDVPLVGNQSCLADCTYFTDLPFSHILEPSMTSYTTTRKSVLTSTKSKKNLAEASVKMRGASLTPDGMPEFLEEPVDAFVLRGKSAEMNCRVRFAAKAYFVCNGEPMVESPLHKEHDLVDDGHVVKELRLEVTRNMVEEFFGQFSCRCEAWSAKGKSASSNNVSVETACKGNVKVLKGRKKNYY